MLWVFWTCFVPIMTPGPLNRDVKKHLTRAAIAWVAMLDWLHSNWEWWLPLLDYTYAFHQAKKSDFSSLNKKRWNAKPVAFIKQASCPSFACFASYLTKKNINSNILSTRIGRLIDHGYPRHTHELWWTAAGQMIMVVTIKFSFDPLIICFISLQIFADLNVSK